MKPHSPSELLSYTPMFHSRLFTETAKFRDHHFQPTRQGYSKPHSTDSNSKAEEPYLDGNPSFDRPLFVQFCANSPDELLEAAKYVEPYCDAVDLNLGCPQGIARKGNYGAFLQENWTLIHNLIKNLHENLNIPVTAKMRILESREKTLEYAQMILSAGASIITVHGRQRDQKGHNTGMADWSVIRYLRDRLPKETVIFANGNVLQHHDLQECLEQTGADGVMSAEGNLCDPAIFAEVPRPEENDREYWRSRDGRGGFRMDGVLRRYLDILYQYVLETKPPQRPPLFSPMDLSNNAKDINSDPLATHGNDVQHSYIAALDAATEREKHPGYDKSSSHPTDDPSQPPSKKRRKMKSNHPRPTSPSLMSVQGHLFHLLRPLLSTHTHIRNLLARTPSGDMEAYEHILHLVEEVTRQGLIDYEADPEKYEKDMDRAVRWGRKPREEDVDVVSKDNKDNNNSNGNGIENQESAKSNPLERNQSNENEEKDDEEESSLKTIRRCRRPWWICQPYVRPLPAEALKKGGLTASKQKHKPQQQQIAKDTNTEQGTEVLGGARREDPLQTADILEGATGAFPSAREKLDLEDGGSRDEAVKQALLAG